MNGGKRALVIGSGAVGLATARELARSSMEVVVVDSARHIGMGVSSRNSEVLHAGIYYPSGSLKARLCVEGHSMLQKFCTEFHVPYDLCGKLIVASSDVQQAALGDMLEKGIANGVKGLRLISRAEAQEMEPALSCVGALHSPDTGIIDSHALMVALQADVEEHHGVVALNSRVVGGRVSKDGLNPHIVRISSGDTGEEEIPFDIVVNAASLHAPEVASSFEGAHESFKIPRSYFAIGHYCSLSAQNPFSRLIYPVPTDAWLGIHLTIDLQGKARFGPDMHWVQGPADELSYETPDGILQDFEESIRKYWPELPADSLAPSYSGIRPRIYGPGEPAVDFVVDGPAQHGVRGWVNMFGIESPGLTSCLALGMYVRKALLL